MAVFDWIVFVSANGVRYFLDRCKQQQVQLRDSLKIAAIGKKTAAALEDAGLTVDLIPGIANSAGVAQSLIEHVSNSRLLLVRANRGSRELPDLLESAQIPFETMSVYESCDMDRADPTIVDQLNRAAIDWVTVTSSAIARSMVALFGDSLRHTKLVSISPTTSAQLCELGFPPAAEANEYNLEGILQAIEDSISG